MVSQTKNNVAFRWSFLPLLVLFLAGAVFAHGGLKHVIGTVRVVGTDSIVVETPSHEMQTVQITGQTKFTNGGNPSSLSDLKVGSHVVIHAKPTGDKLEAAEVKFGTPEAGSPVKK